jgi:hypothetical protein
LGYLAYLAYKAKEEGRRILVMPEGVDEEEALRLAMKASELQGCRACRGVLPLPAGLKVWARRRRSCSL